MTPSNRSPIIAKVIVGVHVAIVASTFAFAFDLLVERWLNARRRGITLACSFGVTWDNERHDQLLGEWI